MKALICGITGQDGSYLAKLLLEKGYEVWGTSRDAQTSSLNGLKYLGIVDRVKLLSMAPNDFRSVLTAMERSDPDEMYFLAGQSSVGLSFEQPAETLDSLVNGILNVLEAIRIRKKPVRLYNASSSECFGDTGDKPADENTPFYPRSPYAVAKASAHWLVVNYRESYGLYACNGILFNHESPLRPQRFVTQKIISAAHRIAQGSDEVLTLGRLDIRRDWGWAPEYVEAMWLMLQNPKAEDFVVATGESHSLAEFIETAFSILDLDWQAHVRVSDGLYRPSDIYNSLASPAKSARVLGWSAAWKMREVVVNMMSTVRPA